MPGNYPTDARCVRSYTPAHNHSECINFTYSIYKTIVNAIVVAVFLCMLREQLYSEQ